MKSQNHYSIVQKIDELTPSDREKMFDIMQEHFLGLTRDKFSADLDEKNWVIRVNNESNEIQGFSTLKLMQQKIGDETVYGFYSGDTVLSMDAAGDPSWIAAWGEHVFSQADLLKPAKSYWILLSSSFRTYTIISSCFKKYLPDPLDENDPHLLQIMRGFIEQKFPDEYQADKNLVILNNAISYKDRETLKLNFDHKRVATSFFFNANPNYQNGDMLGCMTEIIPNNLTKVGIRVVYGHNTNQGSKDLLVEP